MRPACSWSTGGTIATEIERLLDEDVEAGSDGYDRLEFLSVLAEHYEDERYPMGPVTRRLLGIPADVLLGVDG